MPELESLHLKTDLGLLDCLSHVKGLGEYQAVKQQSVIVDLPIGSCRILGIDGLITAKEAMGGDRDRQTVLQLKAIKERKTEHGPS